MKDMFKEIVKEMTSSSSDIPSSVTKAERNSDDIYYEDEKDDKVMEIISLDEDFDLYTEQVTVPERISLSAQKKNIYFKKKRLQLAEVKIPND